MTARRISRWTCALKPDHESRDNRLGELSGSFGISADEMSRVERALRLTRNEFFLTAYVLALALAALTRKAQSFLELLGTTMGGHDFMSFSLRRCASA